ncbi:hypothetical protein GCM10023084_24170 [Streptomyces lacrimifluminis]|uniref:Uncharacterized protein n=1 Tax=Streptomyces lacrimifluminis TaxID=1500077 RepID=A0A917NP19_9ACTN|nr:hypothetical protein GCM10012282_09090 [Streptomyces lacrimifluminis]
MTESAPPFDLVTMGRIGVDLCPPRSGAPLTLVQTFGEFPGGSAADVAVAGARPGRSSAVVTLTGADASGGHPHQALREFGVHDGWVTGLRAEDIARLRFDAGRLLLRSDHDDPGSLATLESGFPSPTTRKARTSADARCCGRRPCRAGRRPVAAPPVFGQCGDSRGHGGGTAVNRDNNRVRP